jgi:predicted DNA-binding transcriptional regulator YafY
MDWKIVKFLTQYQYDISEKTMPFEEKLDVIQTAIENSDYLEITYLKANDQKTTRIIKPYEAGEMFYANKPFYGIGAYCTKRNQDRVFRIDRILDMKVCEK